MKRSPRSAPSRRCSSANVNRMVSRQTSLFPDDAMNKKKSKEFDIWNLIKRPNTTEPYVLTTRYRVCKNPIRRPKTSLGIRRRKRPDSRADSEGESNHSIATTEFDYDREYFAEEFDFDADRKEDIPDDERNDIRYHGVENTLTEIVRDIETIEITISPAATEPEEMGEVKPRKIGTPSQEVYKRACSLLKVTPVNYFLRNLDKSKIIMPFHPLGVKGAKACAIALLSNSEVQVLDLTGCDLDVDGVGYIADMLRENHFITDLTLAENPLGIKGVKKILDVVAELDNIISLNLSGTGLKETDAEEFQEIFAETNHLRKLILSHNEFREAGGKLLGEYLSWNDTLEELDLSWNHLRNDGAKELAEGLKENRGLRVLDLSWNGFHMKGCEALASALDKNNELVELNLECNRINKDCLNKLMTGLKKNTTLKVLKLAWNPITSAGAQDLLSTIEEKNIPLEEVDIHTQLVESSFVDLVHKLEKERSLRVRYGMVRGQDPMSGSMDEEFLLEENPSVVLMEFARLMGFRPMDLLAAFDKDKSNSLDRNEIKFGLRVYCIPLTERCLDNLVEKLDEDGDGTIDLAEIMSAKAAHRMRESKMHKAAERNIPIEETEVGRVRLKLQRLMARKMDGNPTFRARVELFRESIAQGQLRSTMIETMQKKRDMKTAVLAKRQARKMSSGKSIKTISDGDNEDTLVEIDDDIYEDTTVSEKGSRPQSGVKDDFDTDGAPTDIPRIKTTGSRPPSVNRSMPSSRRSSRSSGLGSAKGLREQVARKNLDVPELDLPSTGRNSRNSKQDPASPSSNSDRYKDTKQEGGDMKGSTETLTPKSTSTLAQVTDRQTDRTNDGGPVKDWLPLNV